MFKQAGYNPPVREANMGHSKVHKANKLIRDKSFYKIVEDLKLCFSHHEMAWELAELLKDVVTGNPVPSTKYQGNLSRLKQYYYELSQGR